MFEALIGMEKNIKIATILWFFSLIREKYWNRIYFFMLNIILIIILIIIRNIYLLIEKFKDMIAEELYFVLKIYFVILVIPDQRYSFIYYIIIITWFISPLHTWILLFNYSIILFYLTLLPYWNKFLK